MKFIQSFAGIATCLIFGSTVWAVDAGQHNEHHPESASAMAKSAQAASENMEPGVSMKMMDEQMKMMQAMHEKMMGAKTEEERKALMADQMKMMQGGMEMMGKMRKMRVEGKVKMKGRMPADCGMQHQMMEKRMEMMEDMLQMMMDRLPPSSTK